MKGCAGALRLSCADHPSPLASGVRRHLLEFAARHNELAQQQFRTQKDDLDELAEEDLRFLGESHRRRLKDLVCKQCASVLRAIMGHKAAWPFNAPVNTQAYPDYLQVVSRPMDLGTIK